MGQRLNIEIHKNGEPLANCYYHWSAYTSSACHKAKAIITSYLNNMEELEDYSDVEKAVFLFLDIGTGAGITEEEIDKFKTTHPELKVKATDRNSGLISITEEGMESTRNWQEGGVDIDIGTGEVNFDVIYGYDEGEIEDCYDNPIYKDLPVSSSLLIMSFEEFETFADEMIKDSYKSSVVYKAPEGFDYPYYVAVE